MVRIVLALALVAILFYAVARFRRQPKAQQQKLAIKFTLGLLAGALLLLILTGRVHWISALFAALIPVARFGLPLLLKFGPFLHQLWRNKAAGNVSGGKESTVTTDYLKLTLRHDTGDMDGEIIAGPYAGSLLSQLSLEQARELLAEYRRYDQESCRLLMAYLQRTHGEQAFADDSSEQRQPPATDGVMNRREALAILGLEEGASDAEIGQAHKKLMQKIHPDRGGSNYLAAKINEAKEFLLSDR